MPPGSNRVTVPISYVAITLRAPLPQQLKPWNVLTFVDSYVVVGVLTCYALLAASDLEAAQITVRCSLIR